MRVWSEVGEASVIERATQQNPWWFSVTLLSVSEGGSVLVQPTSTGHYASVTEDWYGCRCSFAPLGPIGNDAGAWSSGRVVVVDCPANGAPSLLIQLAKPFDTTTFSPNSVRNLQVREHDFYASLATWGAQISARGGPDGASSPAPDDWLAKLTRTAVPRGLRRPPPAMLDVDTAKSHAIGGEARRVRVIWGPPGTGKTFTAGHLVVGQVLLGKRVLVLSISNRAVDQAILGADDAWRAQHGGEPPSDNTTLVRVRQPQHPDLRGRDRAHLIAGWDEAVKLWTERRSALLARLAKLTGRANEQARVAVLADLELVRVGLEEEQRKLVKRSKAVFATLTHQRLSSVLPLDDFDLVLVDEAGFAGAAVATLAAEKAGPDCQIVFAGDFQQLGPIVGYSPKDRAKKSEAKLVRRPYPPPVFHDYPDPPLHFPWVNDENQRRAKLPMVEAWYRSTAYSMLGLEDVRVGRDRVAQARRQAAIADGWLDLLDVQRRMPADLAEFLSRVIYGGPGVVRSPHDWARAPGPLRDTSGGQPSMLWFNADKMSAKCGVLSSKLTANLCVQAATRALDGGAASVFVLTRFNQQVKEIRTQLHQALRDQPEARARVEVSTVHKAQGGERDVVIFDVIVTVPWWLNGQAPDSAHWRDECRLVNVALSRAKRQVLVLGHDSFKASHPVLGAYERVAGRWAR